jgi:hypothetical protein
MKQIGRIVCKCGESHDFFEDTSNEVGIPLIADFLETHHPHGPIKTIRLDDGQTATVIVPINEAGQVEVKGISITVTKES